MNHNHTDRGALHVTTCNACRFLSTLLSDAGVPYQVTDDSVEARVHIAGQEMGNKPTLIAERPDGDVGVSDLVGELRRALQRHQAYASRCLVWHLADEHPCYATRLIADLPAHRDLAGMHSVLHASGVGHHDSAGAEHLVSPVDEYRLGALLRKDDQRDESRWHKDVKAAYHSQREKAARAQREQVMIDSARNLKRAIEHADGTVGNRTTLTELGDVHLSVGFRKPITLARATLSYGGALHTGIGTALCRPGDRWLPRIGESMAVGRALRALGHQLENYGRAIDIEHSKETNDRRYRP